MEEDSRIVLNRQQLRETILIDRLNQLWNENKVVYVLMLLGMFVIAIVTILYVLEVVVVPSSRYSFLERVEAQRFRKYVQLRKYENSILRYNGLPPLGQPIKLNSTAQPTTAAGGGRGRVTQHTQPTQHEPAQHEKPQHQHQSQHHYRSHSHQKTRPHKGN